MIVTIPSLASGAKGYFAFLVNVKKSGDFTINFTINFPINFTVEALLIP